MPSYPEVSRLLRDHVRRYAKENHLQPEDALEQLAARAGVSVATLRSWRSGQRRPSEEAGVPLAEVLTGSAPEQAAFLDRWAHARNEKVVAWPERVYSGNFRLTIQAAAYAGAGDFWTSIVKKLLNWAGVHHGVIHARQDFNFIKLRDLLWQPGSLDVGMGILATPEMLIKLHIIEAPIRYRVNAVVSNEALRSGAVPVEILRRFLVSDPLREAELRRSPRPALSSFRIVAMQGEVGQFYIQDLLGVLPNGQLTKGLEPAEYLVLMRDCHPAIAVADEITCLTLLRHMRRENFPGELVYPLRIGAPEEVKDAGALLPDFPLSIAVSRNQREVHTQELIDFLQEAMKLFLRSDARWIAAQYLKLRAEVRQLALEALPEERPRAIDLWLNYTFGLAPAHSVGVPGEWPWGEVLRIASAIV